MRFLPMVALLSWLAGCVGAGQPQGASLNPSQVAAEKLIDAFYSYDRRQLLAALVDAPASQPQLLFYQGWAEGGNYAIINRAPCQFVGEREITCAITVRDDLIAALGTSYWVTDKFHLTIREGQIVQVSNTSNDPPEFDLALNWLRQERPSIMAGPCRGFFAGGPTPTDCVRAVVEGFKAYRASTQSNQPSQSDRSKRPSFNAPCMTASVPNEYHPTNEKLAFGRAGNESERHEPGAKLS